MAINFLNTVDLNFNQLNKAAIQNLGADPAVGVLGQLIFNTSGTGLLKVCTTASSTGPVVNAVWVEVGGGVESFTSGDGTASTGEAITVNTSATGDVTAEVFKYAGGANVGYVPQGGVVTKFLEGNGNWTVPTGTYALPQMTTTVRGGAELFSDTVQSVAATAVSETASRTYGTQLNAANQLVVNVPWTDTNVVTYTIDVPTGTTSINLKGSDSTDDPIVLSGTSGQVTQTRISASEIRTALTASVAIANNLTLTDGVFTQTAGDTNTFHGQVHIPLVPSDTNSATSKQYVDAANVGQSVFQGGYAASTNTPKLDTVDNIAVTKGWFWAVTDTGDFFDEEVQPGDLIYADVNQDANNAGNDAAKWVVIQSGQDIAGAATTDVLTTKGVSGFDSASFNVTANGWVQLKPQSNPYAKAVLLDNGGSATPATSAVTMADAGGETTFTIDITDTTLFGAGAVASNCSVQIVATTGRQTVYPDVTGNGAGSIDIKFAPTVAVDIYTALISYI